jgi:hypothetical protein
MNALLSKELKLLFRENNTYYFLMFYGAVHALLFLSAVVPLLHGLAPYPGMLQSAGKILAGRLFAAQIVLIALAYPSISIKLMTAERNGENIQLLRISPRGYGKILCWKFSASAIAWMLMILLVVPLFIFSFSLGGISLKELGVLFALTGGVLLGCGCIGIFFVTIIKNPALSLAATYGSVFVLIWVAGYALNPDSLMIRFLFFSF